MVRARSVPASRKLVIGAVGLRGRGGKLLAGFLERPDIEVAAVCDVDSAVLDRSCATVEKARGRRPEAVADFRRILDNRGIDAVMLGTPDHWHAIHSILACQAGKHVYVEKPASYNISEGERMVAAARKHRRVVQVGCQSRSGRHFAEAMAYIRTGALGRVALARAWESSRQSPIGYPKDTRACRLESITTSGSVRRPNVRSTRRGFTARGAGSSITGPAISAMTACIGLTSRAAP